MNDAPATLPADSLRLLVDSLVDYAGLFPPSKLPMDEAVSNYAKYRASADSWMLGRFIVPVSRLSEFEKAASDHLPRDRDDDPWPISALVGPDADTDIEANRAVGLALDLAIAAVDLLLVIVAHDFL